jgi:5-formyltetrahydrofolate cyclo-ligase
MAAFNEPRTADIISRALSDGKKVCVPVTNEADCTLTLSYIQGTDSLVRGAYGIYEPAVIDGADTSAPDMITVPGIVFDKSGNRIGFGKGFYDRLLSEARAVRVGICYAFQLSENISPDKHDIPMDIIITEEETLICKPTVILPHGAQRLQQ